MRDSSGKTDLKKKFRSVGIVLAILFFYFYMIPLFWPKPTVLIEAPDKAEIWDKPEVTVTISSLHSNINLSNVYLLIDRNNSTILGKDSKLLYTIQMHRKRKLSVWPSFKINRITFPRRKTYKLKMDLAKLAEEGKIKKGSLKGTVHVVLEYPRLGKYNRLYRGGYRCRNMRKKKKVDMELSD